MPTHHTETLAKSGIQVGNVGGIMIIHVYVCMFVCMYPNSFKFAELPHSRFGTWPEGVGPDGSYIYVYIHIYIYIHSYT